MKLDQFCIITAGLILGAFFLIQPPFLSAEGVKTFYKQYSIFTYENEEFLCEPYQVKKDDWLYKIFRKKGEISAADFPRFLKIFKELNPKLHNIDAIEPGHHILIPLKRIDPDTYVQQAQGVVEVPVLEFNMEVAEAELAAYVKSHTIQKGDTVSGLLAKEFLNKNGSVSEAGKRAFSQLNPNVKDINTIYLGSQILIPDPAMLSQPWFASFLDSGVSELPQTGEMATTAQPEMSSPPIEARDLSRLKRYAQLIQGTLLHQGELVFPGRNGQPPQVVDLAQTPVIEQKDGSRTLIVPEYLPPAQVEQDLLEGLKTYWKEIQVQELNKALAKALWLFKQYPSLDEHPKALEPVIQQMLKETEYTYFPPGPISIQVATIPVEVSIARIVRDNHPDTLVNLGNIYGMALSSLESMGYEVLTLSSDLTYGQVIEQVFNALGFTTWKNPAFNTGKEVESLEGIYAAQNTEKYFITRINLSQEADDFLISEGIHTITLTQE